LAMGSLQIAANLEQDASRLLWRKLAFFAQQMTKILALHEVHGDELDPVCLSEVEDANDVLVGDLARKDQLLLEAAQDLGVFREFPAYEFDGNNSIQFGVARLVDRAHATSTEQLEYLVAAG